MQHLGGGCGTGGIGTWAVLAGIPESKKGSGAWGARVQAAVGLRRRRGCIVFAARGSVAAENGQPIKRKAL